MKSISRLKQMVEAVQTPEEIQDARKGAGVLMKRVLYFKPLRTSPPDGAEVVVLLQDGTYDIAKYSLPAKRFLNRKSQMVRPKFWFEFPEPPTGVKHES